MKTRVLTGAVGGILAIIVLTLLPVMVTRVAMSLLCVIGMYELLSVIGQKKHKLLLIICSAFAASTPFWDMFGDLLPCAAIILGYILLLAIVQLIYNKTLRIEDTMFILATSLMIVLPIASLSYLCAVPYHGRAYIFLALIIAWLADMGAYFAGTLFGKHKLCPNISPKKTVEGLAGGMVCSVLFSLIGALIYQYAILGDGASVVYWQVAVVALLLSPLSVVGDLFCSVIKRQKGIKDYGNLFPGHGGVLDRFDSLIFISPALCVICAYMPMVS